MNMHLTRLNIAHYSFLLIACLTFAAEVQAQSPTATQSSFFAWDYPDELLADSQVARFELRVDGATAFDVGLSALSSAPESYFAQVPPMPLGQHLLEVRACGSGGCGTWSAPLLFHFDGTIGPSPDAEPTPDPDPGGDISLSAAPRTGGRRGIRLEWNGATTTSVVIRKNGGVLTTTANDGRYNDRNVSRGKRYTYQVCETGSQPVCSVSVAVDY